jgi:hypothetical protein
MDEDNKRTLTERIGGALGIALFVGMMATAGAIMYKGCEAAIELNNINKKLDKQSSNLYNYTPRDMYRTKP